MASKTTTTMTGTTGKPELLVGVVVGAVDTAGVAVAVAVGEGVGVGVGARVGDGVGGASSVSPVPPRTSESVESATQCGEVTVDVAGPEKAVPIPLSISVLVTLLLGLATRLSSSWPGVVSMTGPLNRPIDGVVKAMTALPSAAADRTTCVLALYGLPARQLPETSRPAPAWKVAAD